MRRLLLGDKHLRVRDLGETRGRAPVVLVHGAGASSATWLAVARRLARRRRVVAPDLPGHGQSDPWHDASIDLYRDAVGTVCATLQLDKVVLVGHSMGAAIALRAALAWPARIVGLVLVAAGARLAVDGELLALLRRDPAHAGEVLERLWYSPSTHRDVVARGMAAQLAAPHETVIADLAACNGWDVTDKLRDIHIPTLVVAGADDLVTPPRLAVELARGLGNARAVILDDAAHVPFHEQPDAFQVALDGFLREVP